jgi:hypothetical protein
LSTFDAGAGTPAASPQHPKPSGAIIKP